MFVSRFVMHEQYTRVRVHACERGSVCVCVCVRARARARACACVREPSCVLASNPCTSKRTCVRNKLNYVFRGIPPERRLLAGLVNAILT